jgi:NAD(P)-dependent dehydrogenase (short-subunit alcohol dehydrogenase family)
MRHHTFMAKPVCIVVGIGPGIGSALARRFAADGYAVALLTRNLEHAAGLDGRAYSCDAGDPASLAAAFAAVERDLGAPEVLLWNAGSGVFGTVETVTVEQFEASWRVNALGAFAAAKLVVPGMKERGRGAIVFVGATASVKAGARSAAFGPAKFAQRGLAQALARNLGPAGIHVALIVVDGVVDLPATRQRMADKPDAFFIRPDAVAATAAALVAQDRSAWSFEVEARPFGETW